MNTTYLYLTCVSGYSKILNQQDKEKPKEIRTSPLDNLDSDLDDSPFGEIVTAIALSRSRKRSNLTWGSPDIVDKPVQR